MDEANIDFLKKKYDLAPKRVPKSKKRLVFRGILALSVLGVALLFTASYQISRSQYPDTSSSLSFVNTLRSLVTSGDKTLSGEEDDRINVLLLGIGGAGHDGPELTDTMILASFRPSTNEVGMLSIPRDLVVPIDGYGYRKINNINAFAEMAEKGSGPAASVAAVEDLFGQKIHYYVKADFSSFEELIDAVGGIDVYVDRSFVDTTYPTDDHLVQTISFTEGWAHMDGETALEFSRSRHGNNGEGTDFARAARQQKVLLAAKDKILSSQVLLNPSKLNKMIELVTTNVKTNMTGWEMLKFARFAPNIANDNVSHYVLDSSAGSPLYASTINGAYVLLPRRDDYAELKTIAENIFTEGTTGTIAEAPKTLEKTATVEIKNGTTTIGLAFEASLLLDGAGFEIVTIGNADSKDYEKTIIYDLTKGAKEEELARLKDYLEAEISLTPGGWLASDTVEPRVLTLDEPPTASTTGIDFLVILGANAAPLVLAN